MEQVAKNVWSFPVVLPENPLKWLNCYVIRDPAGGRNLLIDTGFNRAECREALLGGMKELGLRPEDTDVFLTHLHSDHTGNAKTLQEMGCRLLMSETDLQIHQTERWTEREQRMLAEGMPPEVLRQVNANNPARLYAPKRFQAETLQEGAELVYGGFRLRCVSTPGHTPGHMCLYAPEQKLMFLGDHVLFDITPNIAFWVEMEDALGAYLESLRKIMDYEVELALPAHRNLGTVSLRQRIEALQRHHAARLAEAEQVVRSHPGIHAYDTAGLMTWKIRARDWDSFPPGQKWFAVGEALTHLDYLTLRGRLRRETGTDGLVRYWAET